MKAKVEQMFKDKYTGAVYETGQVIDVTKERYEEMNSTAHGVLVKAVDEPEKTKPSAKTSTRSKSKK